jgi:hypothetical protein
MVGELAAIDVRSVEGIKKEGSQGRKPQGRLSMVEGLKEQQELSPEVTVSAAATPAGQSSDPGSGIEALIYGECGFIGVRSF